MNHLASRGFWRCYNDLPTNVRELPDKNFALLKCREAASLNKTFHRCGTTWVGSLRPAKSIPRPVNLVVELSGRREVNPNVISRTGIGSHDALQKTNEPGVPNVYSINGRLYYEPPFGELSTTDPYPDTNNATEQD